MCCFQKLTLFCYPTSVCIALSFVRKGGNFSLTNEQLLYKISNVKKVVFVSSVPSPHFSLSFNIAVSLESSVTSFITSGVRLGALSRLHA